MKLKRRMPKLNLTKALPSRRVLIILAIVTPLVVIGVFVWWSKYTWDHYQTSYEKWRTTTLTQARDALALPVANDQDRSAKFEALKKVSTTITSARKSLCSLPAIVGWQQRFIENLKVREQKCQKIVGNFATFSEKLRAATGYLEKEQMLTRVLHEAPAKTELSEADWADAAAGWHATVGKIDALEADTVFTPTKQAARDAAAKVDAAWQALQAAHAAKNKTQYLEAKAQLAQSYGALAAVTDIDATQLKGLIDPLQSAYDNLNTL